MNRIDSKFKELKKRRKKAFIVFFTAGDPDLQTTEQLVLAVEKAGVDLVEIGVPFSDPLADGPTIQAASQRALKHHVNLPKILDLVARLRKKTAIPICLMSYYNPIFHFGEEKFIKKAFQSGVDGLIVPDLPPEEATGLIPAARRNGLSTIFFLAPTTTRERMKTIVAASSGFVYYVSLTGVTGARQQIPSSFRQQVKVAKRLTKLPICVGFGVSTPAQVKAVAEIADGVIVGSAIVKEIQKNKGNQDLVKNVARFISQLSAPIS
ncbi:MAG: tryptophan synthase subunit alpha [Candidatus Omnitrophota bacterium]|nr:tryptophan synthase subunit alpha [Candidatus Omnitrophota bacterium]